MKKIRKKNYDKIMKRFVLMLLVAAFNVCAWAIDDVVLNFGTGSTWTINYSGGDAVTGVTIDVATPGDLYTIKGDMAYDNNATYNMWHVEGKTVVITGTLNDNDVEVLTVNEGPRWVAYAKASVLNLTGATLPDDAENKIKTAWNSQHYGDYSGLKLPGDDDTPGGETPADTRTIELRHAGELLGDVINVPLGSNYQFSVQAFNFQGDNLTTANISVDNTDLCTAAADNLALAKYSQRTVTITPNSSSETGSTTITITLKGASDATEKSVVLTVNIYDPTVATSFSIYPASPITVDKGSTTDVEVRIEPAEATLGISEVSGLTGVTAGFETIDGKKYVRINTSAAESTGTATFTLTPNGLSPVDVTVNVVAPRVPVTATCPETIRFGQNDLSASAVLEVEEAEKSKYTISYSSKNPEFLTVNSETGALSPVALGNATITVTVTPKEDSEAEYAEFTQDFPVSVAKGQYTFTAAADPAFFVVGEGGGTSTLSYSNVKLNGVDATDGFSVAYSLKGEKDGVSREDNVVKIASTATAGTVTAVATLTPTGADASNYESATAEVDIIIGTPQITLSFGDQTIAKSAGTSNVNGYGKVTPEADFSNNTTFEFSAKSDNENIVTVAWDPSSVNQYTNSVNFTPISCGETYVTLTVKATNNSGKSTMGAERIKVTVTNPLKFTLTDGNLKVNYDQPLTLDAIKSTVAKVYTGYDDNPTIVSSGYEIEVYNGDDKVTEDIPAIHTEGYTFTIKVKATNPEYSDAVGSKSKIVDITHLTSFDLALNADKTSILDNGQKATITLAATITEDEITTDVAISSYDMTYSLSDADVATVVKDGNTITVTGQKAGTVTVTVTAHPTDGSTYATVANSTTITVTESQKVYLTTETIDGKDYVVVNVPEGGAFGGISDTPKLDDSKCTVDLADLKAAKNVKVVGLLANSDVQELVNLLGITTEPTESQIIYSIDMGEAKMTEAITARGAVCSLVPTNGKSLENVKALVLPQPAEEVENGTVLPSQLNKFFTNQYTNSHNSLESLTIPDGWTEIEAGFSSFPGSDGNAPEAFQKLTSLNLPNSMEKIGAYAFSGMQVVTLYIPQNIQRIGDFAFNTASKLQDIYFTGHAPTYVSRTAFSTQSQMTNNTVDDAVFNDTHNPVTTRDRYSNGTGDAKVLACIMHYPAEYKSEYIDTTRVYTVVDTSEKFYDKGNVQNGTSFVPEGWSEDFMTLINSKSANWDMDSYYTDGGFPDKTYGMSFVWPSQSQMTSGYAIANAGYRWSTEPLDPVTQYDPSATYENGGVDKRGLYQFIVAMANAPKDKDKWVFPANYENDKWYTFSVPFDMTVEQIHNVFGPNTQVCRISKVIRDTSVTPNVLRLEFRKSVMQESFTVAADTTYTDGVKKAGIRHHWPYMIKPGAPVSELGASFQEDGKRVLPDYESIPGNLMIETEVAVKSDRTTKTDKEYMFCPILMKGKIKKNSYVLTAKNGIHQFIFYKGTKNKETGLYEDGSTASANTAYVQLIHGDEDNDTFFPSATINASKLMFASYFGEENLDNSTTGVEKIEIVCGAENTDNDKVYTISGVLVNGNSLTPGLYIKNGKKFVVK